MWSEVVSRARYNKERTLITSHGKKAAAVVPIEDLELLEMVIEELERRQDLREAVAALEEVKTEGTVGWEDVKAELDL
jgi:prevent-host-death family protein